MNWYILKNVSGRNVGPIGGARFAGLPKLPLVKKRAVATAPANKVIHEVWSNQARHYFHFIQDRDTVALRHQSHKLIIINFLLPGRILTLSDIYQGVRILTPCIHCILKYIYLWPAFTDIILHWLCLQSLYQTPMLPNCLHAERIR